MRGVSLLRERAHLFAACAPIGGIVQMGMISHSMQYQWTSSTIPFAKIRMAAAGSPTAAKKHRHSITSSARLMRGSRTAATRISREGKIRRGDKFGHVLGQ
jgi:hypothetical protein